MDGLKMVNQSDVKKKWYFHRHWLMSWSGTDQKMKNQMSQRLLIMPKTLTTAPQTKTEINSEWITHNFQEMGSLSCVLLDAFNVVKCYVITLGLSSSDIEHWPHHWCLGWPWYTGKVDSVVVCHGGKWWNRMLLLQTVETGWYNSACIARYQNCNTCMSKTGRIVGSSLLNGWKNNLNWIFFHTAG